MYEWQQIIQTMIDEIDESLINHHSDQRTLHHLAKKLGYSEYYTTRKFKAVTGMSLRDYLKNRKLAFALKAVRDGNQRLLNIALDFGFSSHEAFTRAFKKRYGITPSAYRKNPRPLVLRTKISPIDYYFLKPEMAKPPAKTEIRIYFVTIPAMLSYIFAIIKAMVTGISGKNKIRSKSGSKDHLWHTGQYQREAR